MDVYVRGLALYSAQILALVIVATLSIIVLRSASARVRLTYWRLILAACLLLPLVPPQVLEIDAAPVGTVSAVLADAPAHTAAVSRLSASALVIWVVAAGILIRALWLAIGLTRLRRLRRDAARAELYDDLFVLRRSLAPAADVCWHDGIAQPVTFGLAPPVVLLPTRLREMAPELQRAVLCHELLHAGRGDWLSAVVEETVRTVFWFHPAIWWVIDRIQLCREETVDALAVSITASKRRYMQALVAFGDPSPLILAPAPRFARRRELVVRIRQLSQENRMSRTRVALSAVAVILVIAGCGWTVVSAIPLRTEIRLRHGLALAATSSVSVIPVTSAVRPASQAVIAPPLPPPPPPPPPPDGKSNPRVLVGPKPPYPPEALPHSPGASVWVTIKIDSGGQVLEAKATKWRLTIEDSIDDPNYWASKPERPFVEAAAAAALQWKFAPPDANTRTSIDLLFTFRNIRGGLPLVAATSGPAVAEAASPLFKESARAVRVGGSIRPPVKIADVKPIYPEDARAQGVEGVVVLEVRIGGDGSVKDATVLKSSPSLDDAALVAVRQWRFVPTLINGEPTDLIMNVTFNFTTR